MVTPGRELRVKSREKSQETIVLFQFEVLAPFVSIFVIMLHNILQIES